LTSTEGSSSWPPIDTRQTRTWIRQHRWAGVVESKITVEGRHAGQHEWGRSKVVD